MMKIITWIRYKLISENRMFWNNFHLFGITHKSTIFIYYKYFFKVIGMIISLILGFGFAFILSHILQLNSDISWILYFLFFYVISPWFEGKQFSPIQVPELSLMKSLLQFQGVGLDFVKQLYYAQYSFRTSIISETLTVIGFSIVYSQSVLNLLIFLVLGELMRFSVMSLSSISSNTLAIYSNIKSSYLRNLVFGTIIVVFVSTLIIVRLTFFSNSDLSVALMNPYSSLHTILNKIESLNFANLSFYSWFPGTMAVQASFRLQVIPLLSFLCINFLIDIITYTLASLNQSHGKSAFYADLTPLLSDSAVINLLNKGRLYYAQEKEAFLNPIYKRSKLLLISVLFITTASVILLATSNELIRFSLFFILIMWLSVSDKDVFTYNSPFKFNLSESLLFSNMSVRAMLVNKLVAATIFQYVYIVFIVIASLTFFQKYQLIIAAFFWGLSLIIGKSSIRILGSLYTFQFLEAADKPNKELNNAKNKLFQIITSPLSFVLLVLLWQPTILKVQYWFYPFIVYTLCCYIMVVLILMIGLTRVVRHLTSLIFSVVAIGIISGIPIVFMLSSFLNHGLFILALAVWIQLIWLSGNFIHHYRITKPFYRL